MFDSKAGVYSTPFYSRNSDTALRDFQRAAMEEGNNINIHAGDYTLFRIGHFNEDSGVITPFDGFENLGNALDVRSKVKELRHG